MMFAEFMLINRERLGISQQKLADELGLSRASIANYESGIQSVKLKAALLISKKLGFSLDDVTEDPDKAQLRLIRREKKIAYYEQQLSKIRYKAEKLRESK